MVYREQIAIDKGIDNTAPFLSEGYRYISNRTKKYNRNMFETRLLGGKEFVCMTGKEAAKVFYDDEKFKRHGAAPSRVLKTLFGEEGVQTLDGEQHRHRKALFMSMMTKERLQEMNTIVEAEWLKAVEEWEHKDKVILYEETKTVLTRSVCMWAGVPLLEKDAEKFATELGAMYEAGGAIGIRHMRGKSDRKNVEKQAEELISSVRQGLIQPSEHTPLYKISFHRDLDGELLKLHTASVELLNILRPVVAISVYVAFCGLALHEFPQEKKKLENASKDGYKRFVQEVRRYYPFFPVAVAQVRDDFLWNGHDFKKDTYVLLDLYGTNHHTDLWKQPNEFRPDRFNNWDEDPFSFIPQGGGDFDIGHRCAGEWITVNVMTVILDKLVNRMTYSVPDQNLDYSMVRMPSLPKSKFIIEDIKKT